jgi:hypothetical protein
MTHYPIPLTLSCAFASALLRGFISVIDRYQFGMRGHSINSTNLHNNLMALALALLTVLLSGQAPQLQTLIIDPRVIVFGLLLQITAHAFSLGFKQMRVAGLTVYAKTADLLIPVAIFVLFQHWSWSEFGFAFATFVACLPALRLNHSGFSFGTVALIVVVLVVQGGLSPWYMSEVAHDHSLWVPFTAALIFWRLVFCMFVSRGGLFTGHCDRSYISMVAVRSLLSLGAQMFLVFCLSFNRPVLAWPILNATGLISVFVSSAILRERASRSELISVILITLLGMTKGFVS